MKFKFKKNGKFKKIVSVVLVIAAVAGLAMGITAISRNDSKNVKASTFSVGSLDENGKYVDNNQAIYTKTAFECRGLRIEPDFEAKLTYDVYYYDANEKLLEAKTGLTEVYDEDLPLAKLCRVVIHPEIPEGETAKSFKITYFDVHKYAKQLKITVDKNQDNLYGNSVNLYVAENAQLGKSFNSEDAALTLTDNAAYKTSGNITVNGDYEYYDVFVKKSAESDSVAAVIASSEDNTIVARASASLNDVNDGEWFKITVKTPELDGEAFLVISLPAASDCYVFGYNK